VALDDAACGRLDFDPGLLDRVGVVERDRGKLLRELAYLRARLLGAIQAFGGGTDVFS